MRSRCRTLKKCVYKRFDIGREEVGYRDAPPLEIQPSALLSFLDTISEPYETHLYQMQQTVMSSQGWTSKIHFLQDFLFPCRLCESAASIIIILIRSAAFYNAAKHRGVG